MRIVVSLAAAVLLCCAMAFAQSTTPAGTSATLKTVSLTAGESTVTGCLKGKADEYYLTEANGTMHILMGPDRVLGQHVDHWVELAGNRDNNRDASASSDEGTPHGLRFFQVEDIVADQGACKR